jgi:hypothetical protein
MPRHPLTRSHLVLDASAPVRLHEGSWGQPVLLPPQIALDCRYTRNRQDAFSLEEVADGYRVRVSGLYVPPSLHVDFHRLPKEYAIHFGGRMREHTFDECDARLALTTEFSTDGKRIFDPSMYLSAFSVQAFSRPGEAIRAGKWSGNPVLPRPIGDHLLRATGYATSEDVENGRLGTLYMKSTVRLLSAHGLIVGQWLQQRSAAAPYIHDDGSFSSRPGAIPLTQANGALHYETSAVTIDQVRRIVEREGPHRDKKIESFLECAQRNLNYEQRPKRNRREVYDRRSDDRRAYCSFHR